MKEKENNLIGTRENKNSVAKPSVASIRFINLLGCGKFRNHHAHLCSISEREGLVPDYSEEQEKRDLKNYRFFMNSSAYDDMKDVESEMSKNQREFSNFVRKIGTFHKSVEKTK